MLTVRQENENQSAAPTLGMSSGIIGQGVIPGQGREVSSKQKGSGRFTNLQSYIRANEPESGGINPNARLIQQRAEQAGTQLGQRQTEFTGGVERVGTGLQGIQERANVAQSAFQDPTRFVQSPENLKRFTALRTGQEKIPGVTETYGQIEPLRQGLTSQQRQIAEGLRTDVGQNLQEYIRSQRPNPALATLGETQLDRFLTEQTPSGLSAIESAVSRAGQIESEQTPAQERLTQLESLRSQLAENPLVTQSGILNRLASERGTTEQTIRNITPGFLQEKVGLSGDRLSQAESQKNIYDNLTNTINNLNSEIQGASSRLSQIDSFVNQKRQEKNNIENELNRFINAYPNEGRTPQDINWNGRIVSRRSYIDELQRAINNTEKEINENLINRNSVTNDINIRNNQLANAQQTLNNTNFELLPLLQNYQSRLGRTRQQILSEYDPATLARIQAIGQLAGRGFEDMLGGRLT